MAVNLKSLVGKLDDLCRRSLEGAAGLCLSRTNYNVEVEHWLLKLVEQPNSDIAAIFRFFEVDASRVLKNLSRGLDTFKTGNSRAPSLAPSTADVAERAWLLASLEFGALRVRSGHVLLAMLTNESVGAQVTDLSEELRKISPESLRKSLRDITVDTSESSQEVAAIADGKAGSAPTAGGALDQYTIDITARARKGQIDRVLGRDPEIRQIIDILTRRRQNNPILTGEAGVGKTAILEGFAQRIVDGDVPEPLQKVVLRSLDLGLLQAGAGIKGEFESRLKSVIDEVKASPQPIILFIDEAHTLIGAGGAAGQNDAANMLKPALARGELRTIAATTWAEYKKYFERDAALARRFQVVKVDEPSEKTAVVMMRGLMPVLEKHHGVTILDEAVTEAVRLSHRYISGRQLPDKAVSLLDTACARVAIAQSSTPPQLEDCRRRIDQLETEIGVLTREMAMGTDHHAKVKEQTEAQEEARIELAALEQRWKKELSLVNVIRDLRKRITAATAPVPSAANYAKAATAPVAPAAIARAAVPTPSAPAPEPAPAAVYEDADALRGELSKATAELETIQGESPLLEVCVDAQAVAAIVSAWTGIPVGRMVSDEINTILHLRQKLAERIIGQDHALDAIAQSIRTSRANMTDPRKPIGVFLLVGSSGVGKTETAIALTELLYGGDQNMTVINMSEFKEEHKVSLLMGSPPGYVGYGEGGVLTEAVRRRPYSVVLLDEMEKAHPGVQDVFYQVFDKGTLKDGEGRDIDFKNTVIIMTSNAATDLVVKMCADPETRPDAGALAEALHPELMKTFKPAFLGRVTVVPYFPLAEDVIRKIITLQLGRVRRRVRDNYKATFDYGPQVVDYIAQRCKEVHTGGRNVEHIISRTLLPELSAEFLQRMADGQTINSVRVDINGEGKFQYAVA